MASFVWGYEGHPDRHAELVHQFVLCLQLCISIDHRVDTDKLQHRLSGVRPCIRDGCSLANSIIRHPQSHTDTYFLRGSK